ncbi:MAG: DUF6236 family protein [Verrucomicrobiota bacterium]
MSRTILYYPNIEVPTSGVWIRKALLYWDHVASIVPGKYMVHEGYKEIFQWKNNDLQYLYDKGIFRVLNPEELAYKKPNAPHQLAAELKQVLPNLTTGTRLRKSCKQSVKQRLTSEIYKQKVNRPTFEYLQQRGLAEERNLTRTDQTCYYFDSEVANIYMALLAKYLASEATDLTVPGTDNMGLIESSYCPIPEAEKSLCVSAHFRDVLPVPTADVTIQKILEFRANYRLELLAFRQQMDQFGKRLTECQNTGEIKVLVEGFKETIERECCILGQALNTSKISTVVGSLQAFFKPSSPTILGAAAVMAGLATSIATLPASLIACGAIAAGAIEVAAYHIRKSEEERAYIEKSPFAYLFLAKNKLV